MYTQQTGHQGEQAALSYLRNQGLRLIARNFSCRMGEIDLIMADRSRLHHDILVFTEVRYRRRSDYGGAAASVTPTKQRRIIRTAKRFIQIHKPFGDWPCRFDIMALNGDPQRPHIRWIKNAFSA